MARATVLPIVDETRCFSHKGIRHVLGKLIISAGDYATEVAVGDLLLVSNEYRQVATIVNDLSLTVANAFSNNANDVAPKVLRTLTNITGSIDVTASAQVVGVGTLFLSQVSKGDLLVIGTATVGEARKVVSVTDNTHLTVDSAFTDLANDVAPQICKLRSLSDGLPDWDVITGQIDPAASIAVTGVQTQFLGSGIYFDARVPNVLSSFPPLEFVVRGRGGWLYRFRPKKKLVQLTGTIDTTASAIVNGVGTLFRTELRPGDHLVCQTETRFVISIQSNTALTVQRAFSDNPNDTAPKKRIYDGTIKNGRLQIRGMVVAGGAAAALTDALSDKGSILSKESAGNDAIELAQLSTAALPNSVVDDEIDFEGYFEAGL